MEDDGGANGLHIADDCAASRLEHKADGGWAKQLNSS
jgi:hypothetical protein